MQRSITTLAILLCTCGPNVSATSEDTGDTSAAGDDDDDTFEPTATQTDPTASTVTSVDVTSDGSQDTGVSDDTTTTEDSASNFIVEPDGGGVGFECDLWIDDCPAGQKCMPWANDGGNAWNASKCTPLAEDPKDVGEPCSIPEYSPDGIDDCGAHAMCFYVDPDTLMGECIAFCTGSESNPSCENPCTHCAINGDGVLILCLPACDPLLQDCNEGQACYANTNNNTFTCAPDAGAEMGALGDPCEFINVCDPGLFCADPTTVPDCEAAGCCALFCDALAEDPCAGMPEGVECIPWYEDGEAPPCGTGVVGGCMLPE
jgi:hypothetical protein